VGEDSGTLRLRAVLEPRGPAGAIVLSDDQVATLGGTKAPPVLVTVNRVMVRARVARMGGENLLGFSKKLRADLGVQIGETVEIVIVLDSGARTVDVPPALAAVLDREPDAKAAFDKLAPSHQKEFVRWIVDAKRDETQRSRIEQTLQMLRDGRIRR
jgi:hypothetical protein